MNFEVVIQALCDAEVEKDLLIVPELEGLLEAAEGESYRDSEERG